jgi:hypothetical protein
MLSNFQRIEEVLTQNIVAKVSKVWVWDAGSEIQDLAKNLFQIPVPGVKRHRIQDPQHCFYP